MVFLQKRPRYPFCIYLYIGIHYRYLSFYNQDLLVFVLPFVLNLIRSYNLKYYLITPNLSNSILYFLFFFVNYFLITLNFFLIVFNFSNNFFLYRYWWKWYFNLFKSISIKLWLT